MTKSLLLSLMPLLLSAGSLSKSSEFLEGKYIYNETCVSCHGEKGIGNSSIKLLVKSRRLDESILTQLQMQKVISDGGHAWGAYTDIMPAVKYVYTQEQISYVALYISQEFNSQRDKRVSKLIKESDETVMTPTEMLKKGQKILLRIE
jgi:mono/diheme cytochrome c family protein